MNVTLRPYQVDVVNGVREKMRAGKKRVLMVLPPGGGKTRSFAEIVRGAENKGSSVLVLAHRRELIKQASDKLNDVDVRHGIIMPGEPVMKQRRVQVASVATLVRKLDQYDFDVIIVDEAHRTVKGGSYDKVLNAYHKAYVIGATATPLRLDGKGLGDLYDDMVVGISAMELKKLGFLVRLGGWEYKAIDTKGVRVQGGDYVATDLANRMGKALIGNVVDEWKRWSDGKRTVAFAIDIEHSKKVVEAFKARGVPAEHIDGTMKTPERDAILARLRSGQTLVVSNVQVLTEGTDIPELETCLLLCPTLSLTKFIQSVGRIFRPAPGKEVARIHDHAGNLHRHGHPYLDRNWVLKKTADNRTTGYGDPRGAVSVKLECPSCKSITSGWPCDNCKHPGPTTQLEFLTNTDRRFVEEYETLNPEIELKRKQQEARAQRWARLDVAEKVDAWLRAVEKHGPRRAVGVYRFLSGDTEWPRVQWRLNAGEKLPERLMNAYKAGKVA